MFWEHFKKNSNTYNQLHKYKIAGIKKLIKKFKISHKYDHN